MIRTEYNAWEIEVLLDFYRFTKQEKYLSRAVILGDELRKTQTRDGAFSFSDTDPRVWSGEPGLCAWNLYCLYYYTKDESYKTMADAAVEYVKTHPVLPQKNEKELYYVFVAWNIYPFLFRSNFFKDPTARLHLIAEADKLVAAQKKNGKWTHMLHYDLYVGWVLTYVYEATKEKKYLTSVLKLLERVESHKTPIGLYPIHYLPRGLVEMGSGYSSNQVSRLLYYLYFLTGNVEFKQKADILLPRIKQKLSRENGIAKLYFQHRKNDLATMWYEHNLLLEKLKHSNEYFDNKMSS